MKSLDLTRRRITKIAREVNKFTLRTLKDSGVGSSEFDFIHVVRKNPGITQAGIRDILGLDKGAAARRAANLEAKGYIVRKPHPTDKRSQLLFATPKSESLKDSKSSLEFSYYEWLVEDLSSEELDSFIVTLNKLYEKSKAESKKGFPNISKHAKNSGGVSNV